MRLISSSHSDNQEIITTEQAVLVYTSGYRCWQCEKPLRPQFCGVHADLGPNSIYNNPLLFVTCSSSCQQDVLRVCRENGVSAEVWKPARVRRWLDHNENVAGVIQSSRSRGGVGPFRLLHHNGTQSDEGGTNG
jgi:hypothetical protein